MCWRDKKVLLVKATRYVRLIAHQKLVAYHRPESSKVSDTEYNGAQSYVFAAFLSVNCLPRHQGPVSDAMN